MNKLELGIFAGLGIAGTLIFAMWRIGDETLRTLALLFVGGLLTIGAILASAAPIRALRKKDATGETHYVHDGTKVIRETRIIDGRPAAPAPEVKLLQLPAQAPGVAFPELLRAAWQAGILGQGTPQPRQLEAQDPDIVDGDDPDGWGGRVIP